MGSFNRLILCYSKCGLCHWTPSGLKKTCQTFTHVWFSENSDLWPACRSSSWSSQVAQSPGVQSTYWNQDSSSVIGFSFCAAKHVSNHQRATEEWLQTAVQTQYLSSCLLSPSARNADMHFFPSLLPFPPSLFLSFLLILLCLSLFLWMQTVTFN